MSSHWSGVAETGTLAGRRFPAADLTPGAAVTPTPDWFAAWRVPFVMLSLAIAAPSGSSAAVVAGLTRWDYRLGVNPAVEAAPLMEAGTACQLDDHRATTAAPVWPPDTCGGRTALVLDPPLARSYAPGSVLYFYGADHWTGIAETGADDGRRFPDTDLVPGAMVTPTPDWFAPWRVPLWSVPLVLDAPSGSNALVVAGWGRWDYRLGVNPEVEAVPLVASGAPCHVDGQAYLTLAPIWPADTCGGQTGVLLAPTLVEDYAAGAVLWFSVDRTLGAVRLVPEDHFTSERLNATLCTLADALNLMAGELLVTYEGAIPVPSGTWDAAEGILASALYVGLRNGLRAPALLPVAATLDRPGVVRQAAHVGDAGLSPGNTADLWPVLNDLEVAAEAAGWLLEVADAG